MIYRLLCLSFIGVMPGIEAARADPAPLQLSYAAYVGGLSAISLDASLAMTPQAYRVAVSYTLTGVVGAFLSGSATTSVAGRFQGDAAIPVDFVSTGEFRGAPRITRIDWRDGNPVIVELRPPVEEEREPVPVPDQAHTVDSLSAMAVLLHQVAATGRCEGTVRTFDGRRLAVLQAQTVGEEMLEPTRRSIFQGPALRCDFEGRQLGGFMRDGDQAALRTPMRGSAWFARLTPGGAPVPVRMSFGVRSFGRATMYLTGGS